MVDGSHSHQRTWLVPTSTPSLPNLPERQEKPWQWVKCPKCRAALPPDAECQALHSWVAHARSL